MVALTFKSGIKKLLPCDDANVVLQTILSVQSENALIPISYMGKVVAMVLVGDVSCWEFTYVKDDEEASHADD